MSATATAPLAPEIEELAEAIHSIYPVTAEGEPLDWGHISRSHHERAAVYRDVARRLIEAHRSGEPTAGIIQPAP